ncbi:kinetoplast-associated protein-like protein [Leptomonas seymouri]|uniref:Kinetoplast-associated protein-like protein n=1 Tax=Leptomonas seymouri TaxID=5684 RepID=A0A0N1PC89_LEPSE|nr:kinetoplast-associated protein-like protein [Leptomonas seymouri]|eukprot:KPI85064.1 kinetoplast-associated protein-like protein [Leptomonas seymouri]
MAPRIPRKKRVHLPGAARRFVPPAAASTVAAAASAQPIATAPKAQAATPIEPPMQAEATIPAAEAPTLPAEPAAATKLSSMAPVTEATASTTAPATAAVPTVTVTVASANGVEAPTAMVSQHPPQPTPAVAERTTAEAPNLAVTDVSPQGIAPPSAFTSTAPAAAPSSASHRGVIRRSRSRTSHRSSAKAHNTRAKSSSGNNRRCTLEVSETRDATVRATPVSAAPPPPDPTAVTPAQAAATPVEAAAASDVHPHSMATPSPPLPPPSAFPSTRRATISRLPKKKKFFSELEESAKAAETAADAAMQDAPSPAPEAAASTFEPAAEAAATITSTAAAPSLPRRATISRLPKKRARIAEDVSAEATVEETPAMVEAPAPNTEASIAADPTAGSKPPVAPTSIPPACPASTPAAAAPRATISRVPRKRKFFADIGDDTPTAGTAVNAASVEAATTIPIVAPHIAAQTTAAELPAAGEATAPPAVKPAAEPLHVPATDTAAVAAPSTGHRAIISRTAKRKKHTGVAAPVAEPVAEPVTSAAAAGVVEEGTGAAARDTHQSVQNVEAAAGEGVREPPAEVSAAAQGAPEATAMLAERPVDTPAARKTRAKKRQKCLSPAALRRREIAALNRIPRRFRPPTPPWHASEVAERAKMEAEPATTAAPPAVAAVEDTVDAVPAAPVEAPPPSTTAAVVEVHAEAGQPTLENERTAPPTTYEEAPEVEVSQGAAETTVVKVETTAAAAPGIKVDVPAPARLHRVTSKAGKRRITRASTQSKKRFFTGLEELPPAAVALPAEDLVVTAVDEKGAALSTAAAAAAAEESAVVQPSVTAVVENAECVSAEEDASVTAETRETAVPKETVDLSPQHAAIDAAEEVGAEVEAITAPSLSTPADKALPAQPKTVRRMNMRALLNSIRAAHKPLKRAQRRNRRKSSKQAKVVVAAAVMDASAPSAVEAVAEGQPTVDVKEVRDATMAIQADDGADAGETEAEAEAVEAGEEDIRTEKTAAAEFADRVAASLDEAQVEISIAAASETRIEPEVAAAVESISTEAVIAAVDASEPAEPTLAKEETVSVVPPDDEAVLVESAARGLTEELTPSSAAYAAGETEVLPSSTARRLAAKKRIKKHAKLAAERLKKRDCPPVPNAAVGDVPLVGAVHAAAEPPIPAVEETSAETLLRNAALTLPSGQVVMESFTEQEMVLRRATLDDSWDVGLRFDWQERTLTISAFPEFERDDARAAHPFVQLYKSKPRWLLKEVNEASATRMKEALGAMKRSLTARFVFQQLTK